MVHSALKDCDIVAVGNYNDTPDTQIKGWVKEARGNISFQPKVTDQTTHVVIAEKQWKNQPAVVKDALERSEQGQKIHIVTFDWLVESLSGKSKRAEGKYSWVKRARAGMKAKGSTAQPRSTRGLMSQVFTDSTEGFLSEAAKKRMTERRRLEQEDQKEKEKQKQEAFRKQRETENLRTLEGLIKRGISKNRNELLTDKHHIYVDGMGFAWDVVLEPVDKTGGPDDPPNVSLQIFESKTEPPTYTFNAKAHKTSKLPQNNIIICLGCNFITAFRSFRNIFKEYTGVDWAKRASTVSKDGTKYKFVLPKDDSVEERGEKGKSRMSSPGGSAASSGSQESKQVDSPPNKALQRLEAKAAQRALDKQFDKQFDKEAVAAGSSSLGKRKEAVASASEDSEDEPPSKLRKSKVEGGSSTTSSV